MTKYSFNIDEQPFEVEIVSVLGNKAQVTVNQKTYEVLMGDNNTQQPVVTKPAMAPAMPPATATAPPPPQSAAPPAPPKPAPTTARGSGVITAPHSGKSTRYSGKGRGQRHRRPSRCRRGSHENGEQPDQPHQRRSQRNPGKQGFEYLHRGSHYGDWLTGLIRRHCAAFIIVLFNFRVFFKAVNENV